MKEYFLLKTIFGRMEKEFMGFDSRSGNLFCANNKRDLYQE
jgi:hypothetical protein